MKPSRVSSGSLMSAVSRVCSVSRPRCSSKSSPSAVCAAAFFESTRWLVTSEMSDGSRWTCSGKRSIRRASSIRLSSRPLTSSPSFSCEVTTIQCLPRPFDAEALHDGLQVEHLLDVARDELADLVDDEHRALCPGLPALHQLVARARRACPA